MSTTREAVRALTGRGRGFLAGGVTAAVCGILTGERDLVAIGALLVLVPLVTVGWMARARHRLTVQRALASTQVELGQPVSVRLDVVNEGLRSPLVLVEERVPFALGSRPRFVVDPLAAGERARLGYQVRSEVRGAFDVGPALLRVQDPFGMVEVERRCPDTDRLLVTPRTEPLPPIRLDVARSGTGDERPRSFARGNAADVTVREYRTGDELRRVHWRSTAHSGELMVRREEQPWQARCTLLLDNRNRAHRGRGSASSLETAVNATASIATHLAARGFEVRLVTSSGEELAHAWHDGGLSAGSRALLARLAVVQGTSTAALVPDWLDETNAATLFIGVLGRIEEHDRPFFVRLARLGGTPRALALDVDAWTSGPNGARSNGAGSTAWLVSLGWRAAVLGPRTPLSTAWTALA